MKVKVNARTLRKMLGIYNYIAQQGYPENSLKFITRIFAFIETLNIFPEKYPVCRHAVWRKRSYRCAVFEKNYVLAYRVGDRELIVMDIRHTSKLA